MKRRYIDGPDRGFDVRKKHKGDSEYTFKIKPREKFDGKFPSFRKPTEVGNMSVDFDKNFHNNKTQLKFYVQPDSLSNVDFDLKIGYKDFIRKDETKKEYVDNILRWIIKDKHKLSKFDSKSKQDSSLHTDFFCWRGLLTKLLCTPYENREDWMIAVTFFNGSYYLCEFETEQKKQQKEQMTPRQDEMSYWGLKFEQYITSGTENGKPNTETPVNNIEAYCTVIRSRLNAHSIVFAGEVDAVDPSLSGESKYVEFKTTREIDHPRQDINFKRFKLIKWWAQSFLVGIEQIICGLRDDDGIVHRLKKYNVHDIPHLVRDIRDPWNPNICFNFLDQFLSFLKKNIKVDDPSVVHLLEWEPHGDIRCRQLPPDSEYKFLPDWYTKPTQTEEKVTD